MHCQTTTLSLSFSSDRHVFRTVNMHSAHSFCQQPAELLACYSANRLAFNVLKPYLRLNLNLVGEPSKTKKPTNYLT